MKVAFLGRLFEIGRNSLCPCHSGLKFKKCCMEKMLSRDNDNPLFLAVPIIRGRRSYKAPVRRRHKK